MSESVNCILPTQAIHWLIAVIIFLKGELHQKSPPKECPSIAHTFGEWAPLYVPSVVSILKCIIVFTRGIYHSSAQDVVSQQIDLKKKPELMHTENNNFPSDHCGRVFSYSSHLNLHLKTQTRKQSHLCSVYVKVTLKYATRKLILWVHAGEKTYTFEKCAKCFHNSQDIKRKLKMHDKKKKILQQNLSEGINSR